MSWFDPSVLPKAQAIFFYNFGDTSFTSNVVAIWGTTVPNCEAELLE
jgi:hypothetical protein